MARTRRGRKPTRRPVKKMRKGGKRPQPDRGMHPMPGWDVEPKTPSGGYKRGGKVKPKRRMAGGGRTRPKPAKRKMYHGGWGTNTHHKFFDVMQPDSPYCVNNGILTTTDCSNSWYQGNCCHGDCQTMQGCQKSCEAVCASETGERNPNNHGSCYNHDGDSAGVCHPNSNTCFHGPNEGQPCETTADCNEPGIPTPPTCECDCYTEETDAVQNPMYGAPGRVPLPRGGKSNKKVGPRPKKRVKRTKRATMKRGGRARPNIRRAKPKRRMVAGGFGNGGPSG